MKANGKYKQSLGLTTVAILLFGVFPPALAAPQENSGPPLPEEDRPICRSGRLQNLS